MEDREGGLIVIVKVFQKTFELVIRASIEALRH
jgi:hypothetical protein